MASSEVDLMVLGYVARQANYYNPLLAENLFKVLGVSLRLSGMLYRARKLRKLDTTRETRSLELYHSIIFLSREGLALTEVFILPYCQGGGIDKGIDRECQVMAARLRAAFYHNFCLYHNNPPVSQLRNTGNTVGNRVGVGATRKAMLRDAIPSITSEASYITNPYDLGGPSPPPSYPIPPIPMTPPRKAPIFPPGLEAPSVYNPPVSTATFLMPAIDFTPPASHYFETAVSLAENLLSAAHPLRLAVMLEYSYFQFDCMGDIAGSLETCKNAVKARFKVEKEVPEILAGDVKAMVHKLAEMGQRCEKVLGVSKVYPEKDKVVSPSQQEPSPPAFPPPTRELPTLPRQQAPSSPARELPVPPVPVVSSGSPHQVKGLGIMNSPSATLVGSPARSPALLPAQYLSDFEAKSDKDTRNGSIHGSVEGESKRSRARSRTSSRSTKSARTRTEGTGSEKERKRRALERAEDELMRKKSANSDTGTVVRVT